MRRLSKRRGIFTWQVGCEHGMSADTLGSGPTVGWIRYMDMDEGNHCDPKD